MLYMELGYRRCNLCVPLQLCIRYLNQTPGCIWSRAIEDVIRVWLSRGPFYKHGLTLIPPWISNHTLYNVLDEITYPFQNFNGATVEV